MIAKVLRYIKSLGRRSKEFKVSDDVKWIGNSYGGFFLKPSLLGPDSCVLSVGIGEDISFDVGVYEIGVRNIHLFDPTPKSISYIENADLPSCFHFYNFGLLNEDTYRKFFLPENDKFVSASVIQHGGQKDKYVTVQFKRLATVMKDLAIQTIDVLKMDIEGSEFDVIEDMLKSEIFPAQICVEYHPRFFKNGAQLLRSSIDSLKTNGYYVGGISRSGDEFLFIRGV